MKKEDVEVMIRIDSIVWNELVSVLAAHPEESLHDPASLKWTSRDVYAHMARWINYSNKLIEAYCAGQTLPSLEATPEEMNSRWQREDRGMELNDAKEKAQMAFSRRQRIIESIPLNQWDNKLERIVRYDGATHFAAHLNYIVVESSSRRVD
jgi:hypothetical protein